MLSGADDEEDDGDGNPKARPRVRKDITLDPVADQRMQAVEGRLGHMENWLNEGMCVVVQKSKEMRTTLNSIESLLGSGGKPIELGTPLTFSAWSASPPALT